MPANRSHSRKPDSRKAKGRPSLGKAAAEKGRASHAPAWPEWLLVSGVFVGAFVVPSVVYFGLRNPFGPPKAFVLAVGATLVLLGVALQPAIAARLVQTARRSRLSWVLAGVVVVAGLASLTAVDVRQAILGSYPDYRGLVSICAYFVIGAGALAVWGREDGAGWIGRAATVAALWVGALGALQRIGAFPTGARGTFGTAWFVSSTPGNSSNLGVFLVVLLPLVVWVGMRDRSLVVRVLAWIGVALGMLSLVWTLSRGAWLAAMIAIVLAGCVLVWRIRPGTRTGLSWRVGVVALILVLGILLTPTFLHRASVLVDPTSSTASWRLSTWRSSVTMTMARPFLGYGPNNFHFAYPRFEAPGQIDGRRGYPIVESAHNLELDTATSFGVLGLLLLATAGILSAIVVVRSMRAKDADWALGLALGISLFAGVVALQFHYVTMDTGPLLALVLAGIVDAESRLREGAAAEEPIGSAPVATVRWTSAALACVYLLVSFAALGLVGADRADQRAVDLASMGAPWRIVSAELSRGEQLAPWEAQVIRARGTVATQVLVKRFDPVAAADGMKAFDAALAMTPDDAVLAAERANLLLAAGVAGRDPTLLRESADAFGSAARMDPNTGVSIVGRATALLALGNTVQAITELRRGLALSPRYAYGWRSLERAYTKVHQPLLAKRAAWLAKKWSQ